MIFDISILSISYILAIASVWLFGFKRSELSVYIALWLTVYLAYTFYIVTRVGSYVDFYVLALIAATVSFLYANRECSLNKRDRIACLLMYLPFVYNIATGNEWINFNYGVFDEFYTPFMQTLYTLMLALSAFNMLFEKIKQDIKREKLNNDDFGALAVGSASGIKFNNCYSLFHDFVKG